MLSFWRQYNSQATSTWFAGVLHNDPPPDKRKDPKGYEEWRKYYAEILNDTKTGYVLTIGGFAEI